MRFYAWILNSEKYAIHIVGMLSKLCIQNMSSLKY